MATEETELVAGATANYAAVEQDSIAQTATPQNVAVQSISETVSSDDGAAQETIAKTAASGDSGEGAETVSSTEPAAGDAAAETGNNTKTTAPEDAAAEEIYAPSAEALTDALGIDETGEIFDLVLRIQRAGEVLNPAVIGFEKDFEYYVPLVAIARTLKIAAEADIEAGIVTGFFNTKDNPYSFNANTLEYARGKQTGSIPEGSIIVHSIGHGLGDIYVKIDALNTILPLRLELNFAEQAIDVKTPFKLPYERERKRKERQEELLLQQQAEADAIPPDFVYVPNNYKFLSLPTLNFTSQVRYDNQDGELQQNLGITGQNDLLGFKADYNLGLTHSNKVLNDDDDKFDVRDFRLKLERKDYGEGSLPLDLKLVEAGDIRYRPPDQIDRTLRGRGVVISSEPNKRLRSFDDVTISGTAQPGWEVEVYRRKELVAFGFVDDTGVYAFDDIPLVYGNNEIRIVLYGPEGQVEERFENYNIDKEMLQPGQTVYEASVFDFERELINTEEEDQEKIGTSKNLFVARGINEHISAFATYTDVPMTDPAAMEDDKTYYTAGANFSALGGVGFVEGYKEKGAGTALDTGFSTNFAGIRLNLRNTFFNDFESEEIEFGEQAKVHELEVRADRGFKMPFGRLGLGLDYERTRRESGDRDTDIDTTQSLNFKKQNLNVNHKTRTNIINGDHSTTNATLNLNYYPHDEWRFRSRLGYDVYPDFDPDNLRLEVRYHDQDKFTAGLEIDQELQRRGTDIELNATYDFESFLGGADLSWSSENDVSVVLRANTSVGPLGNRGFYVPTSKSQSNLTALKSRIYLDNDMSGTFTDGDEPLPGARLMVNTRVTDRADSNGYIDFVGAGAEGLARISLDPNSLDNPFLIALKGDLMTVLRANTKPFIDFPVIISGGIDGFARLPDGTPMSGLKILLKDSFGNVVMDTTAGFDGFYQFEFVKPGTYTIEVDPSHQVNVPTQTVTVTSEELFAYGVELTLLEQAEEVSVASEADGARGRIAHIHHHAPVTDGTLQPAPSSSDGGFQTVVRAVRIGEYPHKVRLVLDLSAPADYQIWSENGGQIINIDLAGTAWDAERMHDLSKHKMFEGMKAYSINAGTGTRLRLTARQAIEVFYNAELPPDQGRDQRVYFDFINR